MLYKKDTEVDGEEFILSDVRDEEGDDDGDDGDVETNKEVEEPAEERCLLDLTWCQQLLLLQETLALHNVVVKTLKTGID